MCRNEQKKEDGESGRSPKDSESTPYKNGNWQFYVLGIANAMWVICYFRHMMAH